MIRSSSKSPTLYRDIIKQAANIAWNDRRYWPLALLAGLLVTAGAYDFIWKIISSITSQNAWLGFFGRLPWPEFVTANRSTFDLALSLIGGLETLLFLALIVFAFCVLSCIAQGGLIYAIGAKRRGNTPTLKEAFHVGAQAFWPIASLNVMAFVVIWVFRFLAALPLFFAVEYTSIATYLVYILAFMVFVPLSFAVAIIHIFALNGMILQGSSLPEALWRAYAMLKTHWVIVVETAVVQTLISIGIWFVCMLAALILLIPAFVMFFTASIIHSNLLMGFAFTASAIFFVGGVILAAAFTVQLQYATWTLLFRRLGEGGAIPKLHRLIRNLFGLFSVPQS